MQQTIHQYIVESAVYSPAAPGMLSAALHPLASDIRRLVMPHNNAIVLAPTYLHELEQQIVDAIWETK